MLKVRYVRVIFSYSYFIDVYLNSYRVLSILYFQIALASFPGSGNTWLRHLIEKMSGNSRIIIPRTVSIMKNFQKLKDKKEQKTKTSITIFSLRPGHFSKRLVKMYR